ncbi:coiled-coil domain-containing protein 82 [Platysternon megacephalum]|uniref:Coiled-coil domain-containing protein 82 n=1 Tax=Platysternon megacephalum TaxID=55544 RepID=A0A4D9DWW1_9SAUR|nr:coiled-coil domain-containing protein 82 [Platysternon megacephalum]
MGHSNSTEVLRHKNTLANPVPILEHLMGLAARKRVWGRAGRTEPVAPIEGLLYQENSQMGPYGPFVLGNFREEVSRQPCSVAGASLSPAHSPAERPYNKHHPWSRNTSIKPCQKMFFKYPRPGLPNPRSRDGKCLLLLSSCPNIPPMPSL